MSRDYLTHRELEVLCDCTMLSQGWVRQVGVLADEYILSAPKWSPYLPCIPDRVYKKDDQVLLLEIKPGNTGNGELKKALGQMMCYYPYDVKAYLVLSLEQWKKLKGLIKLFSWLGVLVYNRSLKYDIPLSLIKHDLPYPVKIVQKATQKRGLVIPFPLSLKPKDSFPSLAPTVKKKWNRNPT
jgi:hypothetical protein